MERCHSGRLGSLQHRHGLALGASMEVVFMLYIMALAHTAGALDIMSCLETGILPRTPAVSLRAWLEDWAREYGSRLLYFEQTSCIDDRTKNLKDQLFNFCYYFQLTAMCSGLRNYMEFPSCKGSECDVAFDWDTLNCIFNALAFQVGPTLQDRNGTKCDILIDGPRPSKKVRQDWIFPVPGSMQRPPCFAPWPNQTTFANQVKCVNDFPKSIVNIDFGMSLSQDKFTCVVSGVCGDSMATGDMQPMYMMCVEKVKGFMFPALDCYDPEREETDGDAMSPMPGVACLDCDGRGLGVAVGSQGRMEGGNKTHGAGTCSKPWAMAVWALALGTTIAAAL